MSRTSRDLEADNEAYFAEMRERLAKPPTKKELAKLRAVGRRMDKLRVKVDFNVVDEMRKMRGGWDPLA